MSRTLLLADDSVTIQRVIELTFADEDIRVLVASDGQQAIQKIDSDRPDIVLADIGMPRVDGYAVATHVKQTASLKHIPVLLLTGAFEPIDEARARKTGCDGVLVKPFEPQKLVARVKELLGGARTADLWPANMPRTAVERVEPARTVVEDLDPVLEPQLGAVFEPASHTLFDVREAVHPPAELPAALEGEDVANRHGDHAFRQSRTELPPPVDRLETELDMLDAALSRLDPTANPQELDEETASDFARDLNELRNESLADEPQVTRPSRPSFGSWDLPKPSNGELTASHPIDILAEEVPLVVPPPAPPLPAPPPPARIEIAPVVMPPTPVTYAPPVVHTPPPVVQAPPAAVFAPAPPAPAPAPPAPAPAPPAPPAASAVPAAPALAAPTIERPTLAAAFGALLAAEKSGPVARVAPSQISDAAIEEVVRRVLARMAGETVNRVVVETAERLIREEISRARNPSGH